MNVQAVCTTLNVTERQLFVRAAKVYKPVISPFADFEKWEQTGNLPEYVEKYIKYRGST